MNICVVGCGYVGLVTASAFADFGNEVVALDVDKKKIKSLSSGGCPIYEPGLKELLERNRKAKRIHFTTSISNAVKKSEIIFICVATPSKKDGSTDLSQIKAAASQIAKNIKSQKIIVNKSTVPIGTGELVEKVINKNLKRPVQFDVVSNPEFLREGQAIRDFFEPDRIVIGSNSEKAAAKVKELYKTLKCPVISTDLYSAELIKYASNAFLATKISFINSIANICETTDANIDDIAMGLGTDKRIGHDFLQAGLGFGGSCFPKDLQSLLSTSIELKVPLKIIKEVIEQNKVRVPRIIERIIKRIGSGKSPKLSGKTISVLGLAFKPNTDDLREAKSIEICNAILKEGASINTYDPIAMEKAKAILKNSKVNFCRNPYNAADKSDAAIFITEWPEFKQLDLKRLTKNMNSAIIFDGRNIYDINEMRKLKIEYHSIGRPSYYP
tara:strand:+ start:1467 stop:2792 length:1326 start_codon:yes stop_codon:yes gene_type:complete